MMDPTAPVDEVCLATGRLAAVVSARPRALHFLVIDHSAAAEVVRAFLAAAVAPFSCRVVLCATCGPEGWPEWCRVSTAADRAAGLVMVETEIGAWPMGAQLHPIGSATLVGTASLIAFAAAVHRDCIHGAVLDAGLRRIQCVHCKAIGEADASSPRHTCAACGTMLKVRSLFSERHQAFLGVAEPELAA